MIIFKMRVGKSTYPNNPEEYYSHYGYVIDYLSKRSYFEGELITYSHLRPQRKKRAKINFKTFKVSNTGNGQYSYYLLPSRVWLNDTVSLTEGEFITYNH